MNIMSRDIFYNKKELKESKHKKEENSAAKMWKKTQDMVKGSNNNNQRVTTPSKFFVVNDLKGLISPQVTTEGSLMKSSDTKIKNQIRLAMEVRRPRTLTF